jgi:DNA mismatch repair protein MutL
VHEVVNKLALSRPDISFKFSSQHKTYFKTPGTGDLMAAAAAIYGQDFSQNLVPAVYDSERYSITGLISVPEVTRASRKNQLFFINNRAIRSPMLYRAVDEGYRGLLITREFPVIMLFINMQGAEVDVNVHPQKNEVRFRDDKVIFRLVTEVIRTTLDKLDYRFNLPASGAQAAPGLGHDTTQIPIYRHQHFDFSSVPKESSGSSYQCETELPTANTWQFPRTDREDQELPPYRVVGQCFDSYILLEKGQELILIDQHAAHERINYERLRSSVGETNVQALAFPVSVQLPLNGMQLLEQNLTTLAGLGFDLDIIGPQEIAIRTAPWAARGHEKESVLEILDLWQEEKAIDLTDEACKMLACKKSIKAGQVLTRLEMEKIIADLLKCTDYKNCPHGRPVLLNISRTEMDHHFKRN